MISLKFNCTRSLSESIRFSAPDSGLSPLKVPEDWLLDMTGPVGEGPDSDALPFMPLPREVGSISGPGDAVYVPLCNTAELGLELVMGVGEAEMRPRASVVASWTSESRNAC